MKESLGVTGSSVCNQGPPASGIGGSDYGRCPGVAGVLRGDTLEVEPICVSRTHQCVGVGTIEDIGIRLVHCSCNQGVRQGQSAVGTGHSDSLPVDGCIEHATVGQRLVVPCVITVGVLVRVRFLVVHAAGSHRFLP